MTYGRLFVSSLQGININHYKLALVFHPDIDDWEKAVNPED